jgi:hypothetical protein
MLCGCGIRLFERESAMLTLPTRWSVSCYLVLLLGCVSITSAQVPEELSQTIPVKISKTSGVYISHALARVQDDSLHVLGTVRRTSLFPADIHSYVQITVLDVHRQVLARKLVSYPQTLLIVKGLRRAPFSLDLPIDSATPAQVNVKVFRGIMPAKHTGTLNES